MSMISSLIDELQRMADGQATYRDARAVMLEAADTIWELRDDLQRANAAVQDAEHDESVAWDRVRKAEADADRLRELVRKVEHYEQAGCHECPHAGICDAGTLYDEECVMSREIEHEKGELGIEVDE